MPLTDEQRAALLADGKVIVQGARIAETAIGVVTNRAYIGCYWPRLNEPTALLAEGSSGLVVCGPPTPRNVVFPADTVFLNGTRGECFSVCAPSCACRQYDRPKPGKEHKVTRCPECCIEIDEVWARTIAQEAASAGEAQP